MKDTRTHRNGTTPRRAFIARLGGATAAVGVVVLVDAPNVIAQPKVQWRMSTAWTSALLYQAAAQDLRRTLDHAAAAAIVYGLTDFHAKNAIALERLRTEFKGKVEILQFPAPMMRELKKFAAEVVREESEKTPMARKVHASFTKFQALVGPWDHVAEGAYHQLVAG